MAKPSDTAPISSAGMSRRWVPPPRRRRLAVLLPLGLAAAALLWLFCARSPRVRSPAFPPSTSCRGSLSNLCPPGDDLFLPPEALQRGLASLGSLHRMGRVVRRLQAGLSVHVVTVGGSTTSGRGAYRGNSYPARFVRWLNAAYPCRGKNEACHKLSNAGMGATPSALFAICLDKLVPLNGDLYVLEFAINDSWNAAIDSGSRASFEILLRRLLRLERAPAVALLQQSSLKRPQARFYTSAESHLDVLAQYYDLPSLSMRNAVFQLAHEDAAGFRLGTTVNDGFKARNLSTPASEKEPERSWEREYLYFDITHPADRTGHAVLADLLKGLCRAAERKLDCVRRREEAGVMLHAPAALPGKEGTVKGFPPTWASFEGPSGGKRVGLPPPMLPGGEASTTVCMTQDEFRGAVSQARGFAWKAMKPEAKSRVDQKWNMIGSEPGDYLELDVDTTLGGGSKAKDAGASDRALLVLGVVRSFQLVGKARLECVRGCACEPKILDARWTERSTQNVLMPHEVTRHPECRVRVTVVEETATESHRFMLSALVVAPLGTRMPYFAENQGDKLIRA
ncbi:hypothetical protein H632_c1539p0 [Helicosporidium sp. ATCC 50920]|nr:hypothetical protein H632_c1539p0 [Helicosporidium sp. ATCC 50920]|eukprot:KDD74140.1 hypothetical protein H632_c1539p0 [Helicosporidium sp. ATCC 50920]